jgi:peptidoglycan/xylan/chitin deacetylase (PgdA/CDA1 family)
MPPTVSTVQGGRVGVSPSGIRMRRCASGGCMNATIRRSVSVLGSSAAGRRLTRRVGGADGLRCLLYHEIADSPSVFTAGLGVTTTPAVLADHLEYLSGSYQFVSMDWVLNAGEREDADRPALLVTFDDAYTSVTNIAADICVDAGAPSVFFVNGALVNNKTLSLDNLVVWILNSHGMAAIEAAAGRRFADLKEFFTSYVASLTLSDREDLFDRLADNASVSPGVLAADASIYVRSEDLVSVRDKQMVIGNHTWSHVHCRSLDRDDVEAEIARNQRFLKETVSQDVDVFSYPYGSGADATDVITSHLDDLGHRAAFLVDSRSNRPDTDQMRLFRVSVGLVETRDLFTELEVFPVLRSLRDRVSRRSA